MTMRSILRILILFCLLALPISQIACTSSEDEDVTVLEEELETLGDGGEEMADDIGDDDLMDIVDEEDASLSDLDEEDSMDTEFEDDEFAEDEGLEDELAESGDVDDEFADEDFDDGELAQGGDEFDEFSEFEEFEEAGAKDPFAQDEEALANELGKGNDYPVVDNAKPQFPEEVIGANKPPFVTGQPIPPGGAIPGQPLPPNNGPLITSETQDLMDLPDPVEPTVPQDDLGMADPIVPLDDDEMPEEQNWIPVVKIKKDAFHRNKRLLNAVYIARPDDSITSISEKIYGEDRSKELLADNPHLLKGVDPGDKLYYNSPNRSEDSGSLKIYYEDVGLPAQNYTTKKNDNMRRLGTKLLGFSEGWKEIWAINPQVDSKTILPRGIDLKYWTGNESKKLEMADSPTGEEESIPDPIEEEGPTGAGMTDDPFAETELPPEPPLPEAEVAVAPDPTLAPEPADIEAFPEDGIEEAPIPPPQVGSVQSSQDGGSLLSIGAIALLIMAGVGLVAIQIKKRKDSTGLSPGSLEYTQV